MAAGGRSRRVGENESVTFEPINVSIGGRRDGESSGNPHAATLSCRSAMNVTGRPRSAARQMNLSILAAGQPNCEGVSSADEGPCDRATRWLGQRLAIHKTGLASRVRASAMCTPERRAKDKGVEPIHAGRAAARTRGLQPVAVHGTVRLSAELMHDPAIAARHTSRAELQIHTPEPLTAWSWHGAAHRPRVRLQGRSRPQTPRDRTTGPGGRALGCRPRSAATHEGVRY